MKKIVGAIVIVAIIIACMCFFLNDKEGYTDVTPDELEKIVDSGEQVYAYFYSENCVTCRKLKANFKELKKENKNIKVYGVNVDKYIENKFIEEVTNYSAPKVIEFVDGSVYKELEDKTMDALREFIVWNNANNTQLTGSMKESLDVYYFYSTTCGECEKTSKYLEDVKKKYNFLNINKFNIYENNNMDYLKTYCKEYNVSKEEFAAVPVVFVRDKYIVEYENIKKDIENYIESGNKKTKCIEYSEIKKNKEEIASVSIIKVIFSALINGINPCSISMLMFLIILLNNKSQDLLKRGLAFCFGKVISLFLIGTILYKFLKYLTGFFIINVLNYIFIGMFVSLAILNIYDFIVIKRNQYGKIKAQLPTKFRKLNHIIIRNTVEKFVKSKWIIPACILLGAVVAFTEFLCSGQIYLSTIVTVIQGNSNNGIQALMYLIVYCSVCALPLIVIILLMSKGVKEIEVSSFFTEHLDKIKIIYAIVFMVMAIYMIVDKI